MKQSDCQAWTITRPCNFHGEIIWKSENKFFLLPLTFFSVPWFLCGFIEFHWYDSLHFPSSYMKGPDGEPPRLSGLYGLSGLPGLPANDFNGFNVHKVRWEVAARLKCNSNEVTDVYCCLVMSSDVSSRAYYTMLHIHELKSKLSIGQDYSNLPFCRKQSIAIVSSKLRSKLQQFSLWAV